MTLDFLGLAPSYIILLGSKLTFMDVSIGSNRDMLALNKRIKFFLTVYNVLINSSQGCILLINVPFLSFSCLPVYKSVKIEWP